MATNRFCGNELLEPTSVGVLRTTLSYACQYVRPDRADHHENAYRGAVALVIDTGRAHLIEDVLERDQHITQYDLSCFLSLIQVKSIAVGYPHLLVRCRLARLARAYNNVPCELAKVLLERVSTPLTKQQHLHLTFGASGGSIGDSRSEILKWLVVFRIPDLVI